MKKYKITSSTETKLVISNSYLEALIEESTMLKKKGLTSFYLEIFDKNGQRLASLVR
jgi:hypothetical protein